MLQILIDGSASNNGASHRNENILTPPVSRCNTPSSFRTTNRREVNAKLWILKTLIQ